MITCVEDTNGDVTLTIEALPAPKEKRKAARAKKANLRARAKKLVKPSKKKVARALPKVSPKYGKAVSAARTKKGLSQRALAKACGVSQPCICNVEKATFAAGAKLKARLAKVLGV